MKLLGGSATKKRTATLTPLLLTLAVILGLLDQHRCLALKCYKNSGCTQSGPNICSEDCQPGTTYCAHHTSAGSVKQFCMSTPDTYRKCAEKATGLNFDCATMTSNQQDAIYEKCGRGGRSAPFTSGARQEDASEEPSEDHGNGNTRPQGNIKICLCKTDNCNKECQCGGKGAAGSKRSSVAVQGILMTIPVMAVTLLFPSV